MEPELPPPERPLEYITEIPSASAAGPLAVGAIALGIPFSLSSMGADLTYLAGASELVIAPLAAVAKMGWPVELLGAVSFLVWIHRATRIVRALAMNQEGTEVPGTTPGWAVGWWFVPFANLIKPFQVVQELWAWSDPSPADRPGESNPRLGAWWGLWLASNILDNVSIRLQQPSDTVMVYTILDLLAKGLNIAAAVLVIQLIRGLSERLAVASRTGAAWQRGPQA